MRIVYIWIEKYKSIQKQEIKLNTKYDINFQRNNMVLSIEKNTSSIDELLYGENIGVTAIVGDNGIGKSTILDFIREIIFNYEELRKKASGFIVWEQDSKLYIHLFMKQELKVADNIKLEENFCLNRDFGLIYYSDMLDLKYYNNLFDDGGAVYTYPSEDDKYKKEPLRNREWIQYNISTSYLIKKSNGNIIKYFHEDIKKQLQLYKKIKYAAANIIPFPIPSIMSIGIMYLDLKFFNDVLDDNLLSYEYMGMGHHGENNTQSYTIGLLKELEEIYKSKTIPSSTPLKVDQLIQWNIFLLYLYNLLESRKKNREDRDDYSDIDSKLKELFGLEILSDKNDFFVILSHCFEKETTESFRAYKDFYRSLEIFRQNKSKKGYNVRFSVPENILNALKETMFNEFIFDDIINFDSFGKIVLDDNSIETHYMNKLGWNGIREFDDFLNLFEKYSRISYNVDFLQFNWGMSSGENNLFCLFSRLFDVMINHYSDLKSVIFLLDELDASFHPKWQQRILKSLTEFIQEHYPYVKFQIILTTHSPVLLSDVPRENTVFMNNESISEHKIEHEQTFAANIATLYYDSFFMEDGSIGEIAQSVIGKLIDTINETNEANIRDDLERRTFFINKFLSSSSNEYSNMNNYNSETVIKKVKYLIDIIGEDFWRYKIAEQFNKLNLINENNNKIEKLLSEFRELEKMDRKKFIRELFIRIKENENDTY